jgi:hypothetical protein
MNNHCWYSLNIDITNALNPEWKWPAYNPNKHFTWIYSAKEMFNPAWLEKTKALGLDITTGLLFYKNNSIESTIAHVDNYKADPTKYAEFGLNWVIGGKGSKMIWYELPKEEPTIKWTTANTPYIEWPTSELTAIEECEIGNELTLVKTGIPHNIYNVTESRWCITARLAFPHPSWEYITAELRSKNLLIERD